MPRYEIVRARTSEDAEKESEYIKDGLAYVEQLETVANSDGTFSVFPIVVPFSKRPVLLPPFVIVAIGLNEDGEGPETDPTKIASTQWEIWDAANETVSIHPTQEEALRTKDAIDRALGI